MHGPININININIKFVYNLISRNAVETVLSVSPHVYVRNCVRLLTVTQNDFVTGRPTAVSKAYQATLDLVNASVQVTRERTSEAVRHKM
jgi:hypothetical protein